MATKKVTSIKERIGGGSERTTSALFGTNENVNRIVQLSVDEFEPNPDQPRQVFDKTALQELGESIKNDGQLQPIIVAVNEDGSYYIVAGERRWRAHRLIGMDTIEAIITDGNPRRIAIIENVQRENLNPFELAESLQKLMESEGFTQQELGKVIGKRQNTVAAVLRLNTLPPTIKKEYPKAEKVSQGVLIEIAQSKTEPEQMKLWDLAKTGRFTVKDARAARGKTKASSPMESVLNQATVLVKRMDKVAMTPGLVKPAQLDELKEKKKEIDRLVRQIVASQEE